MSFGSLKTHAMCLMVNALTNKKYPHGLDYLSVNGDSWDLKKICLERAIFVGMKNS